MSNVGLLSGSLDEFRLVELLQVMGLSTNSGALHLNQADGRTGLIYFGEGSILSCIELDTAALTLGHVLRQLSLATASQLEYAYQLQTHDPLGKRIGERLIDMGTITPEQLAHALKTQALWTLRELALWRQGSYEFHPGEHLASDASDLRIDTTHAIMEVLRYEHEWESLQPFLTEGMRTRVAMAFEPPIGHPLLFHTAAWQVIAHVNEHHTVRRIATALGKPELDVARMVGPLVQERLLIAVGAAGGPGLPEEAQRLSMHNFDLFTLLVHMEQSWLKCKTPADQLIVLATFINRTMKSLGQACHKSGLSLAPNTLAALFEREGLTGINDYHFRIAENAIDVDDFAAYVRQQFDGAARGSISGGKVFYEDASQVLLRALGLAFAAINARIASPIERMQNQEAWEALFATFQSAQPIS